MSDRTQQTLINLAYESLNTALQMRDFLERLHPLAPHLVPTAELVIARQRVDRLKSLHRSLQKGKAE